MDERDVLAQIDAAFGMVERPDHFTDFRHCCECAEHDALLRSRDRETLSLPDVGNAGWDPLCFTSPQGIAYFFPNLARLGLAPPDSSYGWYADQLLFHLCSGFHENKFYDFCTSAQRAAVADLLAHIIESRTELVDSYGSNDEFLRCYELWGQR